MEVRYPTQDEQKDFIALMTPEGTYMSPEEAIRAVISEKAYSNLLKELPYASQAAYMDWQSLQKIQVSEHLRKYGFVKAEELKPIELDWAKYGDINNFELLQEGEQRDENLSKRINMPVFIKFKKYKFKGYFHTYTIMEDGEKAVARTRQEDIDRNRRK